MDYQSWISRAVAFIEAMRALPGETELTAEVGTPLTAEEVEMIRETWRGRHLPGELLRFWTEGSPDLNCRYHWDPPEAEQAVVREKFHRFSLYGGPCFLTSGDVTPERVDTSDFRGDIMRGTPEECQRTLDLWGRAIIILDMGNGDQLGLDPEAPGCDPDDPPVVYLSHDDSSSDQICPRFTEFLTVWEELSYIGPENWFLNFWVDKESKRLSPERHHTAELRRLLTPR